MELPDKTKKIDQQNFKQHLEANTWLRRNGFTYDGYLLDEPWRSFFIERWIKEGYVALKMDISPFVFSLPIGAMDKPWQVDVATT